MSPSPDALAGTVQALLAPGRGLLAADESFPTIEQRFRAHGIPSTAAQRHAYREMLFTTPGLSESISGVILFDETIRDTLGGEPMGAALARRGLVPGIKVDHGTTPLAGFPGEKITEGLDGLRGRLDEYRGLGARFAKWRAVFTIGDHRPTAAALGANAEVLARYAALSQEAALVPIVEPEILMAGDHPIERTEAVATELLRTVFGALDRHRVRLEAMLLKTGMVLAGEAAQPAPDEAVAAATLRAFRRAVPAAVPGIVFLSGGQGEIEATRRLNALALAAAGPWRLTFSYGRALQDSALARWGGDPAQVPAGQAALARRARNNGSAVRGQWRAGLED